MFFKKEIALESLVFYFGDAVDDNTRDPLHSPLCVEALPFVLSWHSLKGEVGAGSDTRVRCQIRVPCVRCVPSPVRRTRRGQRGHSLSHWTQVWISVGLP